MNNKSEIETALKEISDCVDAGLALIDRIALKGVKIKNPLSVDGKEGKEDIAKSSIMESTTRSRFNDCQMLARKQRDGGLRAVELHGLLMKSDSDYEEWNLEAEQIIKESRFSTPNHLTNFKRALVGKYFGDYRDVEKCFSKIAEENLQGKINVLNNFWNQINDWLRELIKQSNKQGDGKKEEEAKKEGVKKAKNLTSKTSSIPEFNLKNRKLRIGSYSRILKASKKPFKLFKAIAEKEAPADHTYKISLSEVAKICDCNSSQAREVIDSLQDSISKKLECKKSHVEEKFIGIEGTGDFHIKCKVVQND